ncbi:MAG: hypothetical protein BGP24_14650 [Lysobacterales bacterium 69-70]|nr:MAG: hypothetical protein ABT27_17755 [Xanthomonadaceae bacterium SCN 69-25]OJY94224.1 MAG: hypothetical protein BGP24_14650 [Xanthomonadales bacterium 69-70]
MGEQVVGAYLSGAVEARPPTLVIGELAPATKDEFGKVVTPARNVAVINVSGGLVNRYEGDLCDPGPLSYQELRSSYDRARTDSTIETIVMRIESPGGMGAALFDLTDHIYATRGEKRVIAVIDDYAYSAAYAIAASCGEIWITRTGGGGSVGVIAYHIDQSAFDAKLGVRITAIYSGAHKNDMSPHAPLDDKTRAWLQERMDSMRTLFAASVARYRGMDVDAVLATEAQVYQGEDCVRIGFADRIGTYYELMEHLETSVEPASGGDSTKFVKGDRVEIKEPHDPAHKFGTIEIVSTETPYGVIVDGMEDMGVHKWYVDSELVAVEENASDDDDTNAGARKKKPMKMSAGLLPVVASGPSPEVALAEFVSRVSISTLPDAVARALIKRGPANQTADTAIAYASSVRDACFAAGVESLAADYVAANTDIAAVRAQLIDAKATGEVEIVTLPPQAATAQKVESATDIYNRRRAAAAGSGHHQRQ